MNKRWLATGGLGVALVAASIVDGFGAMVWTGSGANVRTSIVDGRVIMEDGRLTRADGPAIVREAQAVAERLWRKAGRAPVTRAEHAQEVV